MRLSILGVVLMAGAVVQAAVDDSVQERASVHLEGDGAGAQDPMQMSAMPSKPFDSPRHHYEKAHLMKRMQRTKGDSNTSHPRFRLLEALRGFEQYRDLNMLELNRWRDLYKNVGKQQKKTLEAIHYTRKLNNIEELIYENAMTCKKIISHALHFYGLERHELVAHSQEMEKRGRSADRISVSQTLKHFVRDWADEGAKERNDAFPCILSTLENIRSEGAFDGLLRVLLPGSGVGRLGHEVAKLGGFEVTLNEWSMYMNVGYRFMESRSTSDNFPFHPFIDGISHHRTTKDMLRKVVAPNVDLDPTVLLVEGDFNNAFKDQGGTFDIIVTHFFIDTARNLMAYFDTIRFLLKPGGKWLNLGPLLYGTGPWVQLSLDEIVAVVENMGFEFEDIGDKCGELTFEGKKVCTTEAEYGFDGKALTKNAYAAQVWLVTKP